MWVGKKLPLVFIILNYYFNPYITPSAFQYWASINAIPHHYWITDWSCHFFDLSDLRSVWFYHSQTWAKCKNEVTYGDRTHDLPLSSPLYSLLRHRDCWKFVFGAVKIRLKEANFKRESEQIILHGRLAFTIAQYWFTFGVRYGKIHHETK